MRGQSGPGAGGADSGGDSAQRERPRHRPGLRPGEEPAPGPAGVPPDHGGGHAHVPGGVQVRPGGERGRPPAPEHHWGPGLRRALRRLQPPVYPAVRRGGHQRQPGRQLRPAAGGGVSVRGRRRQGPPLCI